MADAFKFELVSPERLLMSEEVEHVVVPGVEGNFGVLSGHAPLLSSLRPGILEIIGGRSSGKKIYVRGGLAEAGPDGLTILAQQAIEMSDLNKTRLDQEIADVRSELGNTSDENQITNINLALSQLESLKAELNL